MSWEGNEAGSQQKGSEPEGPWTVAWRKCSLEDFLLLGAGWASLPLCYWYSCACELLTAVGHVPMSLTRGRGPSRRRAVSAHPPWGCLTLGRPTRQGQPGPSASTPSWSPDVGDTRLGHRCGHSCLGAPAASPPRPLCPHFFACNVGMMLTPTGCRGNVQSRAGVCRAWGGQPLLRAGDSFSLCNVRKWNLEHV